MSEQQADSKTYTRKELLDLFEKPPEATLLSWSLPEAFQRAAKGKSLDYLQNHYCIAAGSIGEPAVYYSVEGTENSCVISIGYGRSVDPQSVVTQKFSTLLGGKDQSGKVAIETTGTDYDRLEIYIKKLESKDQYTIYLTDPFRSKVYPNKTAKDKEQLVSLAGALMRLIHAGTIVDLAAIKAEIDMLDPAKNTPAALLNTYYASPTVRKLVDDDRERQGKRPFHEALMAGEIKNICEMKLPIPVRH